MTSALQTDKFPLCLLGLGCEWPTRYLSLEVTSHKQVQGRLVGWRNTLSPGTGGRKGELVEFAPGLGLAGGRLGGMRGEGHPTGPPHSHPNPTRITLELWSSTPIYACSFPIKFGF